MEHRFKFLTQQWCWNVVTLSQRVYTTLIINAFNEVLFQTQDLYVTSHPVNHLHFLHLNSFVLLQRKARHYVKVGSIINFCSKSQIVCAQTSCSSGNVKMSDHVGGNKLCIPLPITSCRERIAVSIPIEKAEMHRTASKSDSVSFLSDKHVIISTS